MKHITTKEQFKVDMVYYAIDHEEKVLYNTLIDEDNDFVLHRITEESDFSLICIIDKITWVSPVVETDETFSPETAAFYELGSIDEFPEYFV